MNPNLIVAVKSSFAQMEAGAHDLIRGTWGQALRGKAQVKFFLGRPTMEIGGQTKSVHPTAQNSYNPKSDEVIVDCPDDIDSLVWKTRAICKWMVDKMATHVLITDPQCVVKPSALWASNFQIADYAGTFNGEPVTFGPRTLQGPSGSDVLIHDCFTWATDSYILSKKAASVIAEKVPIQMRYIRGSYDDFWVGQILGPSAQKGELLALALDEVVVCA